MTFNFFTSTIIRNKKPFYMVMKYTKIEEDIENVFIQVIIIIIN